MAASPLADIDWDDLNSAEVTTAIKLLSLATQERRAIGSADLNETAAQNIYWPLSESPTYTPQVSLFDGDPLYTNNAELKIILDGLAGSYVGKSYADNAVGTSPTSLIPTRLNSAADAPATYKNKMFELAGIAGLDDNEIYPDIESLSPLEIKKWYDLITVCKWAPTRGFGRMDDINDAATLNIKGEFDPDIWYGSYIVGIDSANMYGTESGISTGTSTNWDNFLTAHSAAFSSGGDSLDSWDFGSHSYVPDSGAWSGTVNRRYETVVDSSAGLYYVRYVGFRRKYSLDYSGARSKYDFDGIPQDYARYQQLNISGTAGDLDITLPTQTHLDGVLYKPTLTIVDVDSDNQTIEVDDEIVKVSMPATVAGIGTRGILEEEFEYYVDVNYQHLMSNLGSFIALWDAEGGFVYYTPP